MESKGNFNRAISCSQISLTCKQVLAHDRSAWKSQLLLNYNATSCTLLATNCNLNNSRHTEKQATRQQAIKLLIWLKEQPAGREPLASDSSDIFQTNLFAPAIYETPATPPSGEWGLRAPEWGRATCNSRVQQKLQQLTARHN